MLGFTADWASGDLVPDGKEISGAGWFTVANMPEVPPKISIAREIIDWYLEGKPGNSHHLSSFVPTSFRNSLT